MNLIFGYSNVYLDFNSDWDLNSINERKYLRKLFLKLEELLVEDFEKFEFYILFSRNSNVIPGSYNIFEKK